MSTLSKVNKLKTGRLSAIEKKNILEWYQTISVEAIAEKLNRRLEAVKEFVEVYAPKIQADNGDKELLNELYERVYWKNIKTQFSEEEVRAFEIYWINFVKQFNLDIEFSEELQLVDLIRTSILINRNLDERNRAKKEVEILHAKLSVFTDKNGYPPYIKDEVPDVLKMNDYITLANGVKYCEASYVGRTNELNTLMTKKDVYFNELKATRKVRIEILKNIKKDFISLIKSLMDEKTRKSEGLELALRNLAADKELSRLSEYHIYDDGIADKPILNHQTVGELDDQSGESGETETL